MGLTIHYQGGINRTDLIPKLICELEDISTSMGWKSHRVEDCESDPNFRGITISPSDHCESLCFIFDRQGRLRCLTDLILGQIEPTETSHYCATKTQFAAVETHIWIIGLLKYLKKHYMRDLAVSDEGEFWETGDRQVLIEKKQFLQDKIEQFADRLQSVEFQGNLESVDDIIAYLEKLARKLDSK